VTRARFERATPSFGERSDRLILLSISCVYRAKESKVDQFMQNLLDVTTGEPIGLEEQYLAPSALALHAQTSGGQSFRRNNSQNFRKLYDQLRLFLPTSVA
jgi:SUMO ligase MMS21 Smc5/6 complex component